jgi:hypothetical protein
MTPLSSPPIADVAPPSRHAPHPRAIASLALLCAVGLSFHFASTVVSVFPPNPVSTSLTHQVHGYLAPYFTQSWRLFAPDPGGPSFVMLVQCRTRDAQAPTPWIDVTNPLYESTRANRLHPAQALHRVNKGVVAQLFGVRDPFVEHLESQLERDPDNAALRGIVEAADASPRASLEVRARPLMRLATVYCGTIVDPAALAQVRARIDVMEIPPFSRRHEPIDYSAVVTHEFPWVPAEPVAQL